MSTEADDLAQCSAAHLIEHTHCTSLPEWEALQAEVLEFVESADNPDRVGLLIAQALEWARPSAA